MLKNVFTRVIMIYITIATCTICLSNCSEDLATFNEIKSPVVLLSPADGAKIAPEEFPIVFSWEKHDNAKEYELNINNKFIYIGSDTSFTVNYNESEYPISITPNTWSVTARNNFQLYKGSNRSFIVKDNKVPFNIKGEFTSEYSAFCSIDNLYHKTTVCLSAEDDSGVDDLSVYVHEIDYTYPADMYEPYLGKDTQGEKLAYGHFYLNAYDLPCGTYTVDVIVTDVFGNKSSITKTIEIMPEDLSNVEIADKGAILEKRWRVKRPDIYKASDAEYLAKDWRFIYHYINRILFDEESGYLFAQMYILPYCEYYIFIFDEDGNFIRGFPIHTGYIPEGGSFPPAISIAVRNNRIYLNTVPENFELCVYDFYGNLVEKKIYYDENGNDIRNNLYKIPENLHLNYTMGITGTEITNSGEVYSFFYYDDFGGIKDEFVNYLLHFDSNFRLINKYKYPSYSFGIGTEKLFYVEELERLFIGGRIEYNSLVKEGIYSFEYNLHSKNIIYFEYNGGYLHDENCKNNNLIINNGFCNIKYKNSITKSYGAEDRILGRKISVNDISENIPKLLLYIDPGTNNCITKSYCTDFFTAVDFGEDTSIVYAANCFPLIGDTGLIFLEKLDYDLKYWSKVPKSKALDIEIDFYKFRLCGLE